MNNSFNKTYSSTPDNLPIIEEDIINFLSERKIKEAILTNVEMAVSEAAANSIIHGNKSDSNKDVSVKILVTTDKIEITFKDSGKGFKPEEIPDPTIPENILKGSGRGLYIMNSVADNVQYDFNHSGTFLKLTFNLQ